MSDYGRKCYSSHDEALAGAIEQLEQVEVAGEAQSIEDANLRHELRMEAAVRADRNHRELMRKLGEQINRKPLTPDEMSELFYPKGSKHE